MKQSGRKERRQKKVVQEEEWIPKTRLGRLVAEQEIKDIDDVLSSEYPLKEVEIVNLLLPDLVDEVLDINMVQRMTDSGRRVKFDATVVVGNRRGYVGVGIGKDAEVGNAIRKSTRDAKLNIIKVLRGCGSWECKCGTAHSIPYKVEGKASSVKVVIIPAPKGLGLVAGETARKVLELAGVKDAWTQAYGETRTSVNFAKATYDALKQVSLIKQ
ncbi:MAG TPA: 30S ribosomal protein S5 [Halobacteria archaeon]|jgi:small subunit ribosomal protein S5|nr:30S ribosomal protein S5 [Halobacteria archaeon]HIH77399.1 30S ribosomal protein S5 [Halobacteria archaeon]